MTDVPRFIGVLTNITTSPTSTTVTSTLISTTQTQSTTTTTSATPSPSPPPSNIGAIVGGSVAGAIVLCGIAVALTVIIMRQKRQQRQAPVVDNAPSYMPPMQSPMPYTDAVHWNEMDGRGMPMVYELPPKSGNMIVRS